MCAQVIAALEAVQRLHIPAMNGHDLEAFLACFDPDYRSEQPAHPIRGFGGREQVKKNWSALFEGIPDLHADCLPAPRRVTSRALPRVRVCCRGYSYCSASSTFSLEARRAGRIAASIPARIAMPTKTTSVP